MGTYYNNIIFIFLLLLDIEKSEKYLVFNLSLKRELNNSGDWKEFILQSPGDISVDNNNKLNIIIFFYYKINYFFY